MWSQTLGHDKQIGQLRKTLHENKIAHAYLFCGPEGIGKRRVAIGLAQGLNCLGSSSTPCERCLPCEKIAKQIHPDCFPIEPDGKMIRIEVLRDLKQKAFLHPFEGRAKVFMIEAAEKMTASGANALLKILEEPPASTYLILITSKPSLILPTIRSRCQRIEFSPLPAAILKSELEKRGFKPEEAKWRADFSQGSFSQALNLDLDLFNKASDYLEEAVKNAKPQALLRLSESLLEEEEKIPLFFHAFSCLLRQKIIEAEEEKDLPLLTEQWDFLQRTTQALETFANKRLLVESLLFKMTALPS